MNRQLVWCAWNVLAAMVWTVVTFVTSHGAFSVPVGLHAWVALHYARQYHLNRPSVSSRPARDQVTTFCRHQRVPVTLIDGTTVAWICQSCSVTIPNDAWLAAEDITGQTKPEPAWKADPPRYPVTDRRRWVCICPDIEITDLSGRGRETIKGHPRPSCPVHGRPIIIGETGPEMVVPLSYAQHRAKLRAELEAYTWQQRLVARRAAEHAAWKRLADQRVRELRYFRGEP